MSLRRPEVQINVKLFQKKDQNAKISVAALATPDRKSMQCLRPQNTTGKQIKVLQCPAPGDHYYTTRMHAACIT